MKTLFVGQNRIHLQSVDSTNSYATEMLRQISLPDGTLFYSFNQQNGRGQRGNEWESEPMKNVALSYVLYPKFMDANKQFLLTKVIALGVADLLTAIFKNESIVAEVKVKWPNDIYVNNQKIAGVLIENTIRDSLVQSSIVGIGINVNQSYFKNNPKATSLSRICGKEFDLETIIVHLSECIEANYLQLKTNKQNLIDTNYLKVLYRLNQLATYKVENSLIEATIIGVSSAGLLQVKFADDTIIEFDFKKIEFI